jgi:hypothetical protein
MISFMIFAGPRSGTTWAANWLTTDTTLCLHDPMLEFTRSDLNKLTLPNNRRLGISCTSSLYYPEWVKTVHCPKIFLYRDVAEINLSLRALGLQQIDEVSHLKRIAAFDDKIPVLPYEHMFTPSGGEAIADILRVPFDKARHNLLRQMRVEPFWSHVNVTARGIMPLITKALKEKN